MPRFTLRTLMIVMLLVIAFFAGWAVRTPYFAKMQAESLQARAEAEEARAVAQRRAETGERLAFKAARELMRLKNAARPQQTLREPLSFLSWNVESDGNNPATIAEQLQALPEHDAYLLQEVHPSNASTYGDAISEAMGDAYHYLVGNSGRSDRLMIIYDSERLNLQSCTELFNYRDHTLNDWSQSSPLVAHFVDNDGFHFKLVTVHQARGNAKVRQAQAIGLSGWARDQSLPIFAIGDFNFDYSFITKKGNKSFHIFVDDEVFTWAQPEMLIDTNWADHDGDGKDDYPDSCLDFGFHAHLANGMTASSRVFVRDGDFPDNEDTSDHRPVEMVVSH